MSSTWKFGGTFSRSLPRDRALRPFGPYSLHTIRRWEPSHNHVNTSAILFFWTRLQSAKISTAGLQLLSKVTNTSLPRSPVHLPIFSLGISPQASNLLFVAKPKVIFHSRPWIKRNPNTISRSYPPFNISLAILHFSLLSVTVSTKAASSTLQLSTLQVLSPKLLSSSPMPLQSLSGQLRNHQYKSLNPARFGYWCSRFYLASMECIAAAGTINRYGKYIKR